MTPLGHWSVSYLLGRTVRGVREWPIWPFVLGGVLPDIDFLLLPFDGFNELHRVATHSLAFVAAAALVTAAIVRSNRLRIGIAMLAAGALHLLIDSMLDANASNGTGVALLWPFSDRLFSPGNYLANTPPSAGWSDLPAMLATLPVALAIEAPFIIAALWLWIRRHRKNKE